MRKKYYAVQLTLQEEPGFIRYLAARGKYSLIVYRAGAIQFPTFEKALDEARNSADIRRFMEHMGHSPKWSILEIVPDKTVFSSTDSALHCLARAGEEE